MKAKKCPDCGNIITNDDLECPKCGCTRNYFQAVEICPECKGLIENDKASECPSCGFPIKTRNNKHKKTIIISAILLAILIICVIVYVFWKKTEPQRFITKYTEIAQQYKNSLNKDAEILTEIIDTSAQKIIYHINDEIIIHDYATENTQSLISTVSYDDDYECRKTNDFCICEGFSILEKKIIGDRLFLIIESCNDGYLAEEGVGIRVFYIDIKDNSFHYVVRCANAKFNSPEQLSITTYYSGIHQSSVEKRTYTLSTNLTDDEYKNNRNNQSVENEKLHDAISNDEKAKMMEWLQGTWEWSGRIHVYGSKYESVSCRIVINGDFITFYGNNGINDQGSISEIDLDEEIIHFGSHSTIDFSLYNKTLYFDRSKGEQFCKVSSSNSLNVYSNNFSGGSDSRLMGKFNSLNEEGRRLTDEIGRYYRSGQASPYTIQTVYRLKQIQDEKISLAQEMGDKDLEKLCRQQKSQTLTALRQMGF